MADVLCDLVVHPDAHGLPPVTIALTLVATLETMLGGAEPGQVDGHLVPAEAVRELSYTFGLLPRPEVQVHGLPAQRAGGTGAGNKGSESGADARTEEYGVDGSAPT